MERHVKLTGLCADGYVDVMHDEVPTRQHFVDVGADDGEPWFADHMAGRLPSSGDGVESVVSGVRSRSYCHPVPKLDRVPLLSTGRPTSSSRQGDPDPWQ
jgi:hypothetical protein